MNENYDVKGPVRSLKQRKEYKPLTPTVDRLRDFESFDVEFSHEGLVQELRTYTHMGVPDGSEQYLYDPKGNHIRTLRFDNAGVQVSISELEHGAEQGRVQWITRGMSGDLLGRGVDEYRGELLISVSTFQSNGLPLVQKTFEYAGTKRVQALSLYYGIDGNLAERHIVTYDSEGRLTETYGLNPNGEPLGDGRYRYEYDEEGRQSRVLTFNEWSETDVPSHISEFTYKCDERGNWVERRKLWTCRSDSHWRETVTSRKLAYYESG